MQGWNQTNRRDSYIQAAFQEYVDNAVSKTVNLPSDATEQEVDKTFRLTYEFGCKGTTVYRDASRVDGERIITTSNKMTQVHTNLLSPRPRTHKTKGQTTKFRMGCDTLFVSVNKDAIARYYQDKQKQPITIPIATMEEECSIRKERDYADRLSRRKLKETLKRSLEQLPTEDYETIRLCLSGSLSVKETAQKAGIPILVFYKRYQRALKILRKISLDILKEDSGDD